MNASIELTIRFVNHYHRLVHTHASERRISAQAQACDYLLQRIGIHMPVCSLVTTDYIRKNARA